MIKITSIYKKIYNGYMILSLLLVPIMLFSLSKEIIYFTFFLEFIVAIIILYYLKLVYKIIPGKISFYAVLAGMVISVGGSILDMAVTVIYSPDLSEEGNPVIVALLNSQFSLKSIYISMLCYQILKVSISLYCWFNFLKIYPKILKKIPYVNFYTTLKWLFGAQKMSFLDTVIGRNIDYNFLIAGMFFIIFSMNIIHWYAALEWLEIIPIMFSTLTLAVAIIAISLLILGSLTHIQIKNRHKKTTVLLSNES